MEIEPRQPPMATQCWSMLLLRRFQLSKRREGMLH
jgi:hypothetical protein